MVASRNGVKGADRGTGMLYGAKLGPPTGLGIAVVVPDGNWEGIIVWDNFAGWLAFWKVKSERGLVYVTFGLAEDCAPQKFAEESNCCL